MNINLPTIAEAKAILGRDFHGPDQINDFMNCDLDNKGGWIIPFNKKILENYRGKCFLFFGADTDSQGEPITINWLKRKFPIGHQPGFMRDLGRDYSHDDFHKKTVCERKWYLIHKKVPDERNEAGKIICEHQSRIIRATENKLQALRPTESVENAIVYLFGLFLHFLATSEKLYPYDYILCNDLAADGQRVRIGYFEYLQTYVGTSQPGMYSKILALAPSITPTI